MTLHRNAKLGLAGRLALVQAIEGGMSMKAAAAAFSVSPATAHRWWHRWREASEPARSSLTSQLAISRTIWKPEAAPSPRGSCGGSSLVSFSIGPGVKAGRECSLTKGREVSGEAEFDGVWKTC